MIVSTMSILLNPVDVLRLIVAPTEVMQEEMFEGFSKVTLRQGQTIGLEQEFYRALRLWIVEDIH